jgi:K+-transporting ATPase ATPase C chain
MEARQDTPPNASIGSLLRPAIMAAVLFMLIGGLAYPLLTTGVANLVFPERAQGNLIERDGKIVGSELIGQQFIAPQYFHPRPSATLETGSTEDPLPYNAAQSQGSNQGPTNAELISTVEERASAYREENGLPEDAPVPVDAVTALGSGLDPHITPANADLQVPRVARERGVSEDEVRRLVRESTEGRQFGFLGEPRVNVLELNLALDGLQR